MEEDSFGGSSFPFLLLGAARRNHSLPHPVILELELESKDDKMVVEAFLFLSRAQRAGAGAPLKEKERRMSQPLIKREKQRDNWLTHSYLLSS